MEYSIWRLLNYYINSEWVTPKHFSESHCYGKYIWWFCYCVTQWHVIVLIEKCTLLSPSLRTLSLVAMKSEINPYRECDTRNHTCSLFAYYTAMCTVLQWPNAGSPTYRKDSSVQFSDVKPAIQAVVFCGILNPSKRTPVGCISH
jgi:hypothetical protein